MSSCVISIFSEVINEFSALEAGKHLKYSYANRANVLLHVCVHRRWLAAGQRCEMALWLTIHRHDQWRTQDL
jgi:hypothetical protein